MTGTEVEQKEGLTGTIILISEESTVSNCRAAFAIIALHVLGLRYMGLMHESPQPSTALQVWTCPISLSDQLQPMLQFFPSKLVQVVPTRPWHVTSREYSWPNNLNLSSPDAA